MDCGNSSIKYARSRRRTSGGTLVIVVSALINLLHNGLFCTASSIYLFIGKQ